MPCADPAPARVCAGTSSGAGSAATRANNTVSDLRTEAALSFTRAALFAPPVTTDCCLQRSYWLFAAVVVVPAVLVRNCTRASLASPEYASQTVGGFVVSSMLMCRVSEPTDGSG